MSVKICRASSDEFEKALPFVQKIIEAGETYALPCDMSEAEIKDYFFRKDNEVFVAVSDDKIVGIYYLRPNQSGGGAHVSNAGFMVSEEARGKGVARAMAAHALETAKEMAFEAMQFNFVVSTNGGAVKLWQAIGFKIIGVIPQAFHHPQKGKVDAFVMYKFL